MSELFKSARALKIYGAAVLSAAAVCCVLRLLSTLFFFDTEIGYYTSGNILNIFTVYLPIVLIIAIGVLFVLPSTRLSPTFARDTLYTRVCAVFPALGFAAFSVIYITSLIEYAEIYESIPFSYILCAVASLLSCAFFVLKALGKAGSLALVASALFVVIWLVLSLVECYFDTFVPMNAPIKTVFEFSCLSAMLFTVNEMRIGLDKTRDAFRLFCTSAAVIIIPMSSIPSLIGFFSGAMPSSYVLVYHDAVLLLISVFAVARFVQLCFGKTPESPAVSVEAEEAEEALTDMASDTDTEQQSI